MTENKLKPCSEIFSERLAELRQQHGETSRDLARALDVSFSAISNYQLGKRTPDIVFLQKVARHYNVSADYLLGLSDVKSTDQDKYTTLEKYWYQYYTGKQGQRKHCELKLVSANETHPPFASLHEAYAVTQEEFEEADDELMLCNECIQKAWHCIKDDNIQGALHYFARLKYRAERLAMEACQMAAMAIKAEQSIADKMDLEENEIT